MNKNLIITLLTIALIIVGGLFLSERYGQGTIETITEGGDSNGAIGSNVDTGTGKGTDTGTGTFTDEQNSDITTESTGVTKYLYIEGFNFYAPIVTINVGDTIVWRNNDNTPHSIVSDVGTELDSDYLSRRDTYSHTFLVPGEYGYHCKEHPSMKGKVIVQ
jgi:plastocyanin